MGLNKGEIHVNHLGCEDTQADCVSKTKNSNNKTTKGKTTTWNHQISLKYVKNKQQQWGLLNDKMICIHVTNY